MVRVSIISLIYRSPKLADWVYQSVHKFTPMIDRGEAEFFFVANDPTQALLAHLEDRAYPHIVNWNERYTDEELFALGYALPEYMSRVYRGYNEGIRAAKGDYVVLINSDNYFSPDWLENLLKYSDRGRIITSTLIERDHPRFPLFPSAIHGEFGSSAETFDEPGFLAFVSRTSKTGLDVGGAYMPCLIHRDVAIEAGLYPCGNVAADTFGDVARYGDEAFYDMLASLGVEHHTALDSLVYHLKEGERDDESAAEDPSSAAPAGPEGHVARAKAAPYLSVKRIPGLRDRMAPTKRHEMLMDGVCSDEAKRERERRAAEIAAASAAAQAAELEASRVNSALVRQAEQLRSGVERVVGPRLTRPTLRLIHAVSWITRPMRRWMALRGGRA